jgi:RNA polymerase sigma-70 factor (ECF subfamily)
MAVQDRARAVAETTADETKLVESARGGDVSSFSALVRLYADRAVRVATSLTGNRQDGEDSAQEAFVKAYQSLPSFRGTSKFYTWFYRILANVCHDHVRRNRMRGFVGFWKGGDGDRETAVESVPSETPDAARSALDGELEEKLHAALAGLPFRQRSVFALRYLDGLSLAEIAESLGLSEGAVKAHLWQAMQKMKKRLGAYLGKEPENG